MMEQMKDSMFRKNEEKKKNKDVNGSDESGAEGQEEHDLMQKLRQTNKKSNKSAAVTMIKIMQDKKAGSKLNSKPVSKKRLSV